jgi:hypothetical protein
VRGRRSRKLFAGGIQKIKITSEGNRRFGGACRSLTHKIMTGASSRRWRSVACGHWRSLYSTKLAAASPVHCRLVSSGSRSAFLRALRTNDDKVSVSESGCEIGDGGHTILNRLETTNPAPSKRLAMPIQFMEPAACAALTKRGTSPKIGFSVRTEEFFL